MDMWTNIIGLIKQRFDRITDIPANLSLLAGTAKPLLMSVVVTVLSFLGEGIF